MLQTIDSFRDLPWKDLTHIYRAWLEMCAEKSDDPISYNVESLLYEYLRDDFFAVPGAFYALWTECGQPVSALRMEPTETGWLLQALETAPEYRGKGYGAKLLTAACARAWDRNNKPVYSHVEKQNLPSLRTHFACGFFQEKDYACYLDGTVTRNAVTLRWNG